MHANEVPLTKTDAVGNIRKIDVLLVKTKGDKALANGAPLVWIYGKVIGHEYW